MKPNTKILIFVVCCFYFTIPNKLVELFNKWKKSEKWTRLNRLFLERAEQLKESYYTNMVDDLKTSNVGQWYSKIKRMSQIDPTKNEKNLCGGV